MSCLSIWRRLPITHPLTAHRRRLEAKFRNKYPNMVGIHFVSPVQGKGMDVLVNSLRQVVAKQDYIGRTLPSSYLALEKVVAAQAKVRTPPVLAWHEYRDLAKLCMIEDDNEDLRTATALLHNLGSLVHFANDEKVISYAAFSSKRHVLTAGVSCVSCGHDGTTSCKTW